jgi:hypothetical protein
MGMVGDLGHHVSDAKLIVQCKLILNLPDVLPGWGCCQCRVYNGLQRDICRSCPHRCCIEKPKPHEFGLCDECGVPEGVAHVGH